MYTFVHLQLNRDMMWKTNVVAGRSPDAGDMANFGRSTVWAKVL